MYFSSSITVIILLKYRYRQYRYRLENEYRYRQKSGIGTPLKSTYIKVNKIIFFRTANKTK